MGAGTALWIEEVYRLCDELHEVTDKYRNIGRLDVPMSDKQISKAFKGQNKKFLDTNIKNDKRKPVKVITRRID